MSLTVVIVGASTRAAAQSVRLAGYEPWCVDCFADSDLQAIASVARCENWPYDVLEHWPDAPRGPWLYTGALENHPQLLEQLSEPRRILWGNCGEVVQAVRHPARWTRALRAAGFPTLKVAPTPAGLPFDGTWMVKPRRSAGGFGVRLWDARTAATWQAPRGRYYWQQRATGETLGAAFVGARQRAVLLGVTRHLERRWCFGGGDQAGDIFTGQPFAYAGSSGPVALDESLTAHLQALGNVLADQFELRGLFGVDLIRTADGRLLPIEINPRYTASMELLERASIIGTRGTRGRALRVIELHAAACEREELPEQILTVTPGRSAKAILYTPSDNGRRFTTAAAQWCAVRNLQHYLPVTADIPIADEWIPPGRPICTVLADGTDEESLYGELLDAASELYELLGTE